MSLIKSRDSKKWINALVAIFSITVGFVSIRFFDQLSDWFDLEAKISYFLALKQGAGIAIGLLLFIFIQKNHEAVTHLKEVYDELVKVIWPDKDSVVKVTIGIIIAVSIVSGVFVLVDYIVQQLLNLLY
ncbi:MAG: preprotein translocase subunit SecE [Bdellovibrionales bacterium]|jgi:preprotein translocase subunit SecE|nr:preprotein translocase subunit SecE [Bdellovibrionales bacterium]